MGSSSNMGLRESLSSHKGLAAGAVGVVAVMVALMAWQVGGTSSGASGSAGELYYTDDDGSTTFTAAANLLPPFDHNGKQAVRAVMYSCDGGKSKFVAYLERYTVPAKQQIEAARQAAKTGSGGGKMVMGAPASARAGACRK